MSVLTILSLAYCVLAANVTRFSLTVPLAPSPLPPPHPRSDGEAIISLFQTLGRTTIWRSIANISLQSPGYTYEAEGIVRLGSDRYVVSAGDWTVPTVSYGNGLIINGTDRTAGEGSAHFLVYTGNGTLLADATLTSPGEIEYHTGGIDFDGEYIWTTLAQYRPNTTAHIVRVKPSDLSQETVLRVFDHQGAIVHNTAKQTLHTLNWGSRNASTFAYPAGHPHGKPNHYKPPPSINSAYTPPTATVRNPSYFIDYQDCKLLSLASPSYNYRPIMLCSGIATLGTYYLGGIALVDVETMTPVAEVPITLRTDAGVPLTVNPVEASVVNGKLRMYWLPGIGETVLRVHEADPRSPFEFGGGPQ
ncbi:hypothetical protein B0A48_14427 [Cryoendolithus antarcticus]|uniref:Uncharacterized protein n=1 Tax=Cryoendolithus antarcticus TaxID=1507870 RepID=A0A1V8SKI9_9PEZI|nr:hypothetical protein B0A48_14427 [Cryoendolithus antarcticus]